MFPKEFSISFRSRVKIFIIFFMNFKRNFSRYYCKLTEINAEMNAGIVKSMSYDLRIMLRRDGV
jgi:hypothetical protein